MRWSFTESPVGVNKGRKTSWASQSGLCFYCAELTPKCNWTLDHQVPLSRGGSNASHNKVGACYKCNHAKGNMTLAEFISTSYLTQERREALGFFGKPKHYQHAKQEHELRCASPVKHG